MNTQQQQESEQLRIYKPKECAVFFKTKERWGEFSNMAFGYPCLIQLENNEFFIVPSSEALYQAMRFPGATHEDTFIQEQIAFEPNPIQSKRKIHPFREDHTREDWMQCRVKIMRWVLKIKLFSNLKTLWPILEQTKGMEIVEKSTYDNFWGTLENENAPNILIGQNVLGRLLMELRERIFQTGLGNIKKILPPPIPNFTLFNKQIVALHRANINEEHLFQEARVTFWPNMKPRQLILTP